MGPNFVLDKGYQATTAIGKFRAVTLVANDQVKQADGAGQAVIGVCQDEVTAGDATNGRIADIRMLGITRAVNGTAGALARNTRVTVDNVGRVVAAAPAAGANSEVCGITLTSAAAQGDHVDVLLTPGAVMQGA